MDNTVQKLQTEEIPQIRPKLVASTPEIKENILVQSLHAMLPVFGALTSILAVRLFLLFAVIGSFILAQTAMTSEGSHSLWVLVAYCSLTILPLVYMDIYGRKKP